MATKRIITGETLVVVQDLADERTFTAALVEVLPEAGDRLPAIYDLALEGIHRGGGGAAPPFTISLAAE